MKRILLFALFASVFYIAGCKEKTDSIRAGSLCTVEASQGKFGVIKVLVIDEQEVHIKIYKNKYSQRPNVIAPKELSMGSITDKEGFGIGHIPLDREGFDKSNPIVIGFEGVTKDELAGYEIWKNQKNQ